MSEVTIRYVSLDEALAARREDNPKAHDVPRIAASYQHHGVASLVVLNERDGRMVIGAGRTEAVASLRDGGSEPPEGVIVDADGRWLLPALIVDLDTERATSLMLADNRTTELGGWDVPLLAAALLKLAETERSLAAAGFDSAAVDAVVAQLEVVAPEGLADPDALGAPPRLASRVEPGARFALGEHRLVCADASDAGVLTRLLEGQAVDLVFADPPYGVDYVGGSAEALSIPNDTLTPEAQRVLLEAVFDAVRQHLRAGAPYYVCGPGGDREPVVRAAAAALGEVRQTICWVKDAFVLGRQDYHWQHELLFYGWAPGARHTWLGGRDQSTVWQFARPRRSPEHPTQKPVALVERALRNSSRPGAAVLDPFLGSGTTLIACERLGRRGFGVELDPRYAQAAIERWEAVTGQEARRVD